MAAPPEHELVVGLGSNLGDRLATLRAACRAIASEPGLTLLGSSSVWESPPLGPPQPDYLNAAILVRTSLAPSAVLERLLDIERALGRDRTRTVRWGARTIDLDLLFWSGGVVDEPTLHIPHPGLVERAFALQPLLELIPEARDPTSGARYAELPVAREPLLRAGTL